MTEQHIRRHPDGSIDIDFYRRVSQAERRHSVNRVFRLTARSLRRVLWPLSELPERTGSLLQTPGPVRT
jgi:hypothetical protein